MTAREYMTPVVQTVSPRNTLKDAAQILFEHDCGMVPVIDDNVIKGVLTDRDVAIIACNRDRPLSELSVGDVIKDKVFTCKSGDTLTSVMNSMAEHRVRRLPVVGAEGLEGVISFDDLARAASAGAIDAGAFAKAFVTLNS